jgi:hypothetical protein
MSFVVVLGMISCYSGILLILATLYNYRHFDKILKIAAVYFVISTFFDLAFELMRNMRVRNDMPMIHAFIVISIFFFAAIYYYAFFNVLLKKIVLVLSTIALIIVILNAIFNEGIWEYPSISNTALSVLLIFFSLAYFYQLLNRQEFVHIEKQALFWINAGVLFYYAINIFLFMLFKHLTHAQRDYYMIHDITNILANILFSVGLLCKPQKTTSSPY